MRATVRTVLACAAVALAAPAHAGNPQHAGLQVALRAWGLYAGPIDGVLGPQTRAAVRGFQKRAGLPVDGVAGLRTRLKLGPLGRPLFGRRTIRRGNFGWDVSVLQFLLARWGVYVGPIDGYVGPETEAALRRWQRAAKLEVDGRAGPRTLAALGGRTRTPLARPPSRARIYVARPGDSLSAIAERFGTSVAALVRANRLDPRDVLLVGRRLVLPRGSTAPALRPSRDSVPRVLTRWASRYGIDAALVRALAWMESGYQPAVVSPAGARGVLQLLPASRDFVETVLVKRRLPRGVEGDAQVGVLLLRHLLNRFGGDEHLALAAWYQGERGVRDRGVLPETRLFVADVLALKERV